MSSVPDGRDACVGKGVCSELDRGIGLVTQLDRKGRKKNTFAILWVGRWGTVRKRRESNRDNVSWRYGNPCAVQYM